MNDGEQLVKLIFFPSEEDFFMRPKRLNSKGFVVVVLLSCPFANWLLDVLVMVCCLHCFFFPF